MQVLPINFKTIFIAGVVGVAPLAVRAQISDTVAAPTRMFQELIVTGKRSLKDVGVVETKIDSASLKENISHSMADILASGSSLYVKSYGRATEATVSFRGTSAGHTRVLWNGLALDNPMIGTTDFSTIPSFFVDRASLLHGSSSVNETAGGLGGLVRLSTEADQRQGCHADYVQGIGSYRTFDEFLKVNYADSSTAIGLRVSLASSPNDYTYVNHDKKINIYDDAHNIIGSYHPRERNRSGAYRDLNIMQQVSHRFTPVTRLDFNAWYTNSMRELPLLTTDYGTERGYINRQRDNTVRLVGAISNILKDWRLKAEAGYVHNHLSYDYKREVATDNWAVMSRSRSTVNTGLINLGAQWTHGSTWLLTADYRGILNSVSSRDRSVTLNDATSAEVGYSHQRLENSVSVSAKWQPTTTVGLGATVRQETYGKKIPAPVAALFADFVILPSGGLTFSASGSRNYKMPSLNDLYFMPGGNPDLKSEQGYSYDLGLKAAGTPVKNLPLKLEGGINWFDSYINDWIIWLPTPKGYFSPRNVKKVHAYGVEVVAKIAYRPHPDWRLEINGTYAYTPSVNAGSEYSEGDRSIGKQLPYIPRNTATVTGRLRWRSWQLIYNWIHYSQRFTMTSNEYTVSGHLPAYYMNNVTLEKELSLKVTDLQIKLAVNNLFNEDYMSVLSRPMPGINFELFIGFKL